MIKGIAGWLIRSGLRNPRPEKIVEEQLQDAVISLRCLHCNEPFQVKLLTPISLVSGFCPGCESVSKLSAEDVTGYLRFLDMETMATFRDWMPRA